MIGPSDLLVGRSEQHVQYLLALETLFVETLVVQHLGAGSETGIWEEGLQTDPALSREPDPLTTATLS
jgi:hypothetical protein